ncbi:hypothetical protein CERSUDRAFT_89841 [Gelatoporia subvermispora B]|uniref:Uncharacterized protein n=1 Tax=Ceriporiopsis subvermispora (strain B) TaxID=914234 RepID=M2QVY1_CERS8|nr:hypothetical protein CERSUDRAFT_89841 [Gelatoporia subvermispora B]
MTLYTCMAVDCSFKAQKKKKVRRHFKRAHPAARGGLRDPATQSRPDSRKSKPGVGPRNNGQHNEGDMGQILSALPFLTMPNCIRLAAELIETEQREAPAGQTPGLTSQQAHNIATQMLAYCTYNWVNNNADKTADEVEPPSLPASPPPRYAGSERFSSLIAHSQASFSHQQASRDNAHEAGAPIRRQQSVSPALTYVSAPHRSPSIAAPQPQALPLLKNIVQAIGHLRSPSATCANMLDRQLNDQYSNARAAEEIATWCSSVQQFPPEDAGLDAHPAFPFYAFQGPHPEAPDTFSMATHSSLPGVPIPGPVPLDLGSFEAATAGPSQSGLGQEFQQFFESSLYSAHFDGDHTVSSSGPWPSSSLSPVGAPTSSHLWESSSHHDLSHSASFLQANTLHAGHTPGPSMDAYGDSPSISGDSMRSVFGTPPGSSSGLNAEFGASSLSPSSVGTVMQPFYPHYSGNEFGFSSTSFPEGLGL